MAAVSDRLVPSMVQEHCYKCAVEFWMPQTLYNTARRDKQQFFCPNGHGQAYVESEADKFRLERDRLAQQVAQRDDAIRDKERELVAAKGQITKLRKRASAGSCPCCKRTFSNMAAHMKTKHPDFKAEPPALKVVA